MANHENGNVGYGATEAGLLTLDTLSEMAIKALEGTIITKEDIALNRTPFETPEEFIEAIRNARNEGGLVSVGLSVEKCQATAAYPDRLSERSVVEGNCTPEEVSINLTQTEYERNDEGIYTFTCPILEEDFNGELLPTRGQYVIKVRSDGSVMSIEEFSDGRRLYS